MKRWTTSNEVRKRTIKDMKGMGNRAYLRYQKLLKVRNISRTTKSKIYDVAIDPEWTYVAETM